MVTLTFDANVSGGTIVWDNEAPVVTDGTVTVTYEFAPIPEPTTAWLLASGLGALATARRRRAL